MRTLTILLMAACSSTSKTPTPPAVEAATEDPVAASVVATMNPDVRACDDFYEYACGGWLASTQLPEDRPIMTRSFTTIYDENQDVIRKLLEEASTAETPDGLQQKLGAFYGTCMNTEASDALGLAPVQPMLAEVDAITDKAALLELAGKHMSFGPNPFFSGGTWADSKNPDMNVYNLGQDGLGLPERSYYLDDSEKRAGLRAGYISLMIDMMKLAGVPAEKAATDAAAILAFETELAKKHWERADLRDSVKTYNSMTVAEFDATMPNLPIGRWFEGAGVTQEGTIIVQTPSFFVGLDEVITDTDLSTLKAYTKWHLLNWASNYLTQEVADRRFAFYGTALSGTKKQQPRWKQCVSRTDSAMGEMLGKAYVEARFAGESKAVAEEMVAAIFTSFKGNLPNLEWMDDTTRARAVEKADAFIAKLGYPKTFRSYEGLEVSVGDSLGNAVRAGAFNTAHNIDKVGTKVDPDEWHMTPQTVNAYYNPPANEIVFPAGIMQAPFFDKDFPRAMNFGALGMVIGHELTHGFDDEGRKYAPTGELKEWWEPAVSERFEERAECVEKQYGSWEVAGEKVNGKLTLGENIADLGGLKTTHLAYQEWVAKNGEEPTLAGLTGEQQLFVAFAQSWCTNATEEVQRVRVATDPHSPPKFRVNGPAMNLPAFANAFGCSAGDAMAPVDRCEVW